MFRPTLECLEQRDVCTANPAFTAFHDARPQVATALCNNEAYPGVFTYLRETPSSREAVRLPNCVDIDNLLNGAGRNILVDDWSGELSFDRGTMPTNAAAVVATYAGDVNFNSILIGMLLPA